MSDYLIIKYTLKQGGTQTTTLFPAKLVAIFAESRENVNVTSLHSTHVLVQYVYSPTAIKNQLKSQLLLNHTLSCQKNLSNGLYDAKRYCYEKVAVYDRVFYVETKLSIGYLVNDKKDTT